VKLTAISVTGTNAMAMALNDTDICGLPYPGAADARYLLWCYSVYWTATIRPIRR
jgi:hypothetical protein